MSPIFGLHPLDSVCQTHVPKTGGTTLDQILMEFVRKLQKSKSYKIPPGEHLSTESFLDPKAATIYHPNGFESTIHGGCTEKTHRWRVAIIRNPVDRVISNFRHFERFVAFHRHSFRERYACCGLPDHYTREVVRGERNLSLLSFARLLTSRNVATKMIVLGKSSSDTFPKIYVTKKMMQRALEAYASVLLTERWHLSVTKMFNSFGHPAYQPARIKCTWKDPNPYEKNCVKSVRSDSPNKTINALTQSRIEHLNFFDMRLYRLVQKSIVLSTRHLDTTEKR